MRQELTKELLTELYVNQGMNFKEIGRVTGGWDNSWVRRKVIQFGIPLRSKGTELTKEDLERMYVEEQKSQKEIAKLIGRSQCYVRSKMIEFGIESRETGEAQAMKRGIPFNESFFDTWSNEMAYVLGFIYADGSLNDYRLSITLSDKDEQVLHTICDLMSFPKDKLRRYYKKDKNGNTLGYLSLTVSRRKTAKRLQELGVYPNKTKTMGFPDIPDEYLPDFIRGYFDGDGSVSFQSNQICFTFTCGSPNFIVPLKRILSGILDHQVKYRLDKRTSENDPNYSISVHSTRLAEKFYNYIYYDGCPCLERKRKVFEQHMPILCS